MIAPRIHRKLLGAVGLAAGGLLVLSACGNNSSTASSPTTAASSSAPAAAISCASGSLSGQGSTFQANAETEWIKDYTAACPGAKITYAGTGSGAGKTAFGNKTADFGGTDSLPTAAEQTTSDNRCTPGKAIVTPIVTGAVVVTYHLTGVTNLTLDANTVGGIFSKTITKWNDPAIAALNPGVTLPSIPIVPVHRNDSSGTTQIFTTWIDKNDTSWKLSDGQTINWPSGEQSGKGSAGVTAAVGEANGGIGYTELSFAKEDALSFATIKNAAGDAVAASTASVSAALASATLSTADGDLRLTPDYATTSATAYPLSAPSYILTCNSNNANAAVLKSFFTYALSPAGQAVLSSLGYAPLPASLNTQALAQIATFS